MDLYFLKENNQIKFIIQYHKLGEMKQNFYFFYLLINLIKEFIIKLLLNVIFFVMQFLLFHKQAMNNFLVKNHDIR